MAERIVVGGGIVGTSVAYHLADRGASVTLYERAGTLGSATTGMSSLGFRQYGHDGVQMAMKRYGKRLYNEFGAGDDEAIQFDATEVLLLATTDAGAESLERKHASAAGAGAAGELLAGEGVPAAVMLPELRHDAVTAAVHRPNAGYFSAPEPLVDAFARRAERSGARIRTGATVTDLVVEGGAVAGVRVDGERHAAETVVAAAGPWNNEIASWAGVDVPLRQQRLHFLELELGRPLSRPLPKVRHVETGVTFRGRTRDRVLAYRTAPAEDPYEAGADLDPGAAAAVPESVKLTVLEAAETVLPALADADVAYEDVAYPSRTPDGNPVVGRTGRPGFVLAGTNSEGIQLAPAIGNVVASLLEEDPPAYHERVAPTRFD
ncbi:MAG: NAD(P)/FAD-dependent oxidoreductase [Halanaeroarchaeum sp.]